MISRIKVHTLSNEVYFVEVSIPEYIEDVDEYISFWVDENLLFASDFEIEWVKE